MRCGIFVELFLGKLLNYNKMWIKQRRFDGFWTPDPGPLFQLGTGNKIADTQSWEGDHRSISPPKIMTVSHNFWRREPIFGLKANCAGQLFALLTFAAKRSAISRKAFASAPCGSLSMTGIPASEPMPTFGWNGTCPSFSRPFSRKN